MKILPPALIITVGTVMIISAFALFGKKKTAPENLVPVPVMPAGAPFGTKGYNYRGLFIGLIPKGSVPIPGFNSAWQWNIYTSTDFSGAALATGQSDAEVQALGEATDWVDAFRGQQTTPLTVG